MASSQKIGFGMFIPDSLVKKAPDPDPELWLKGNILLYKVYRREKKIHFTAFSRP